MIIIFFSLLSVSSFSSEINFYFQCHKEENECIEMNLINSSEKLFLEKEIAISLDKDKILEAKYIDNETPSYYLLLETSTREKFTSLIKNNLGKILAITYKSKILTAPRIMEEVSGGGMSLSLGGYNRRIPFLEKIATSTPKNNQSLDKKQNSYILIIGLFIFLVLGFNIFFKRN